MGIMSNPRQYKIPDWFLNRQKDIKDGKTGQMMSNLLDNKLREDLERLKKIRAHRGVRVRGQHTKTTGRVDAPLVYRRRNKFGIIAIVKENIQKKNVTFVVIFFTT